MANKAHLARLQQGVWAWNEWLDQHPQIRPNLTGADLRGTDLSMMDLSAAYLSRADLSRADLAGAHLAGADLTEAHLRGAHLSRVERIRANLAEADLGGADLTEAHLAGVDLTRVDLTRGDLSGTDFPGAPSQSTVFGNVDLSTVRGLDTLEPCGPSTIGIDTLERSHGNLPEVFLWGAGVPEDFLTSIRSLVRRAFEFYACVISYNHTDQPFARRLHDPWQGRGIRGWLDEP
jgi:uncharacterized protein YjbI with pentapeptide repeats